MRYNRSHTKTAYRAQWMVNFERRVLELLPTSAGRIEWDDAVYMFNIGRASDDAAARYVKTRE